MKTLSLCISFALATPLAFAETTPVKAGMTQPCPKDISTLSEAQKKLLPESCKTSGLTEKQWWITGGAATAIVAGIAIAAGSGGGGGDDGGGGDTPVPPDDGPVPPDDGPVPPDDIPDEPVAITTTYPNGLSVTMIPGASTATLTLEGDSMEASKQPDGSWLITDPDTKATYIARAFDPATGAITGYSPDKRKIWALDGTTPTGVKKWVMDYRIMVNKGGEISIANNDEIPNDEVLDLKSGGLPFLGINQGMLNMDYYEADSGNATKIIVRDNAALYNSGTMNLTLHKDFSDPSYLYSSHRTGISLSAGSTLYNSSTGTINVNNFFSILSSVQADKKSTFINEGVINASVDEELTAAILNDGYPESATPGIGALFQSMGESADSIWINNGTINANDGYTVYSSGDNVSAVNNGAINVVQGELSADLDYDAVIYVGSEGTSSGTFTNNGVITVDSLDNSETVVMQTSSGTIVNGMTGVINLGSPDKTAAENGTGMTAMKVTDDAGTAINQGTINIYSYDAYVFDRSGSEATLINTGVVNVAPDVTNWTLVKGEEDSVVQDGRNTVSNYTIGTTADGAAGTMTVNNADIVDVSVDTGFTAGTDAKTETFQDVFVGEDIQGTENVKSDSVVWTADAEVDESGNVDVTMTKNGYQDVVKEDDGLQDMAATLEENYTNNALYNSLNLGTAAEVDNAMRQLSGANATSAFKEARVLSQRFNMLADNAIVMPSGFAFNLVDKHDKRAELGNDTRYDMMALSQSFMLNTNQKMQIQYGIARLDGDGIDGRQKAGDNGLTGGYSQFFGLNHSLDLGDGLTLTNALRYDVHQLESNRSINYSGVNQTADSDNSQQYVEWRSQFSIGFTVAEGLSLTPGAGLKLRHTSNDSYSERGAGDFNLTMDASEETAVDALLGVKMKYTGADGWDVNALLEGGPNISYDQSAQTASLQGAGNSQFRVDSEQKGGGVNGVASLGVSYSGDVSHLSFDAYQWKEDGISDKGILLNYKYKF